MNNMKSAFSMITAIFVIVIMSAIGAMVMSMSSKIVKSTTVQYQHEQAVLYAKSYTEFAVMAISANKRGIECVDKIEGEIGKPAKGNGYKVKVDISYIGISSDIKKCTNKLYTLLPASSKTPLTVVIDTYVKYIDPYTVGVNNLWITVHRRTVQKI